MLFFNATVQNINLHDITTFAFGTGKGNEQTITHESYITIFVKSFYKLSTMQSNRAFSHGRHVFAAKEDHYTV